MVRSRLYAIVPVLVSALGVWLTFTQVQQYASSNVVPLGEELQQVLDHALESDSTILKKGQELQLENENLGGHLLTQMADAAQWRPLRDLTKASRNFMSDIVRQEDGIVDFPEIFEFPSAVSGGRHLCFRGNDSHNGTRNSYTFAWEEALPAGSVLLNGTTLITESEYDYVNPWHSHYNLLQFAWWKVNHGCENADRLLMYHKSELRNTTRIGNWITQVLTATALPTQPYDIPLGDQPICFQRALVSRLGVEGLPTQTMQELYAQVQCQVRTFCKLPTTTLSRKLSINVTLMMRNATQRWTNPRAWEKVIDDQCSKVKGCQWISMHVENMTFCEQVKAMMETDIVVSVHGAQLTNMMFMSPGRHMLEIFPKGWVERAGQGKFFFKWLAKWNGLTYEGNWCDDGPRLACPNPKDKKKCWFYIKAQDVGINETYISSWFGGVLKDFKLPELSGSHGDHKVCSCMANMSKF